MGRWGIGIYESDASLDFFNTISAQFIRELGYLFATESISHSIDWTKAVLTVIEIMLLFDRDQVGNILSLYDDETLQRWEKAFLNVWDADWEDDTEEYFEYGASNYRRQHRHVVVEWFRRLKEISAYRVAFLEALLIQDFDPLKTFQPEDPLPYFSLAFRQIDSGEKFSLADEFVTRLIENLIHMISFTLSKENRANAVTFSSDSEYAWVALDVIAHLSEAYAITIGVPLSVVRYWQSEMIIIMKKQWGVEDIADYALYKNVMMIFDRLADLSEKYPPQLFMEDEL